MASVSLASLEASKYETEPNSHRNAANYENLTNDLGHDELRFDLSSGFRRLLVCCIDRIQPAHACAQS